MGNQSNLSTLLAPDGTPYSTGGGGGSTDNAPWRGKLHTLWGDGNPNQQDVNWAFNATAGVSIVAPTPTALTTTTARLVMFRYESDLIVNAFRYHVAAQNITVSHRMAIYQAISGAKVYDNTLATSLVGWNKLTTGLPITLSKNTPYWLAFVATTTGTTASFRTPASPVANSFGVLSGQGNLGWFGPRFAQITLATAGTFPATLPTIANAAFASAGTTGTIPLIFADNSATDALAAQ